MVGGSTRIPKVQKMVSEFFGGKELCKNVNPDEVVAQGAAIHAAKICGDPSGKLQDMVLDDVTPLSLGVSINEGEMSIVVPRNSPTPIRKEKSYQTRNDNQTSIYIPVYEGERARVRDNNLLGEFTLKNLPARPRGQVKYLVTFMIDEDGILKVSAMHQETGNRECITIENTGCLSQREIENMIEQAKHYQEQDNLFRARTIAKNGLLDYAYDMRSRARMSPASLSQRDRDRIITATSEVIEWVDVNPDATKETYDTKKQQLEFTCSPILGGY